MSTTEVEATENMKPEEWFEDVLDKQTRGRGGRTGPSAMGEFKKALRAILSKAADPANRERITLVEGRPALRAGNIANSLKRLFPHIKDEQLQYGRSYRYLRSMKDVLENWGWEIQDYDEKKHLILTNPEKFTKTLAAVTQTGPTPTPDRKTKNQAGEVTG
jgi:hypothetical protein